MASAVQRRDRVAVRHLGGYRCPNLRRDVRANPMKQALIGFGIYVLLLFVAGLAIGTALEIIRYVSQG